jgi:hypothetical protein
MTFMMSLTVKSTPYLKNTLAFHAIQTVAKSIRYLLMRMTFTDSRLILDWSRRDF